MDIDQLIQWYEIVRGWFLYLVPFQWRLIIHAVSALYVGYLVGQFALAERLRKSGYNVMVFRDRSGQRRYFVETNGLELPGEAAYEDESSW